LEKRKNVSLYCRDLKKKWDFYLPSPVAALFKAWVYGRSLAGIAGSNATEGMDICLL
jgi:hypothetical protein